MEFGNTVGKSDVTSQTEMCELHIEMIKPYLERAIYEKNKRGKISIILCTGIGILIAILLT